MADDFCRHNADSALRIFPQLLEMNLQPAGFHVGNSAFLWEMVVIFIHFSPHKSIGFLQAKAFWHDSSQGALHAFDDANPAKWITGKNKSITKLSIFQVVAQKAID